MGDYHDALGWCHMLTIWVGILYLKDLQGHVSILDAFIEGCHFCYIISDIHAWCIWPQPLNIVELSYRFVENVDDYIFVVHKNPFPEAFALYAERYNAIFFQILMY